MSTVVKLDKPTFEQIKTIQKAIAEHSGFKVPYSQIVGKVLANADLERIFGFPINKN